MNWSTDIRPRLRPVEVFQVPEGSSASFGLRDRSGISDVILSMSGPALHILSLMDGTNSFDEIRSWFQASFGQSLAHETLRDLLGHLEGACFLEGATFEERFRSLQAAYQDAGVRHMPHAASLGIVDGSGDPFLRMISDNGKSPKMSPKKVRAIIAPHLDYERGAIAYASAYGTLRDRPCPDRVVILGTNHFGRSTSVVTTGCDFETPLGRTAIDRDFLVRLEDRCGDLRRYELDHVREHSVELQVSWLQFLFGSEAFRIVPFLCPDPCGPTGTAPSDGQGVDLRKFAVALADLANNDSHDTLIVAGADLSHVGASFGDDRALDDAFLAEVRRQDCHALDRLVLADPEGFLGDITKTGNRTRICSAGCIFTLAFAMKGVPASTLCYHQAVDQETQTCVTCSAVVYS